MNGSTLKRQFRQMNNTNTKANGVWDCGSELVLCSLAEIPAVCLDYFLVSRDCSDVGKVSNLMVADLPQ